MGGEGWAGAGDGEGAASVMLSAVAFSSAACAAAAAAASSSAFLRAASSSCRVRSSSSFCRCSSSRRFCSSSCRRCSSSSACRSCRAAGGGMGSRGCQIGEEGMRGTAAVSQQQAQASAGKAAEFIRGHAKQVAGAAAGAGGINSRRAHEAVGARGSPSRTCWCRGAPGTQSWATVPGPAAFAPPSRCAGGRRSPTCP